MQLKLKANAGEFLEPERLKALIRKYSDHIAFPVRLTGGEQHDEAVNKAKALWARPRTEIKDEEYVEFYKALAHDSEDPLLWSHNRVEGKREYTSLLYVPAAAPFDLWNRESPKGVKLYVQRVFITDQATQFLPLYLRFIRGVVDSSELALNVSRELLQQDEAIGAMRTALTRRVLDMLERLAEDAEKYAKFWGEFGALLKEGLVEDFANRDRLAKLMRFSTTKTTGSEQARSLKDYLSDAKPEQQAIYYLIAESPTAARNNPHLEAFKERGIEVLLLTDRLDEWVMQHLTEYDGKPCKDVRRGALDLPATDGAENKAKPDDRERQALLKRVKQVLRERVDEVRVGGRLRQSAACLVLNEHDLGYQMRELLAAAGHQAPAAIPSLELNPEHALVQRLDRETDPGRFERLVVAVVRAGRARRRPAARRSGGVRSAAQRAPGRARRAERRVSESAGASRSSRRDPRSRRRARSGDRRQRRAGRGDRRDLPSAPAPAGHDEQQSRDDARSRFRAPRRGCRALQLSRRRHVGQAATRTAWASATTRSPSSRGAAPAGRAAVSISAASRSAPPSRPRSPRALRRPGS